jgi:hypothetical protein
MVVMGTSLSVVHGLAWWGEAPAGLVAKSHDAVASFRLEDTAALLSQVLPLY